MLGAWQVAVNLSSGELAPQLDACSSFLSWFASAVLVGALTEISSVDPSCWIKGGGRA